MRLKKLDTTSHNFLPRAVGDCYTHMRVVPNMAEVDKAIKITSEYNKLVERINEMVKRWEKK